MATLVKTAASLGGFYRSLGALPNPILSIKAYGEHENPPRLGNSYWIAATDTPAGGRFLNIASGYEGPGIVVYYIMIKNVGLGIARDVEIRIEALGILDVEENTTRIDEFYPDDVCLIPIAASNENVGQRIARCIVRYHDLFKVRYVGYNTEVDLDALSRRTRCSVFLRHPFRAFERKNAEIASYYANLWDSTASFQHIPPVKT